MRNDSNWNSLGDFQKSGSKFLLSSFGTNKIDSDKVFPIIDPNPSFTGSLLNSGIVTITGAFAYLPTIQQRTFVLRICVDTKCSAPEIKILGGDVFSFNTFGTFGKTTSVCPSNPADARFWTSECLVGENAGLVAYIPYDTEKDIKMYVGEKYRKLEPLSSSGILNNLLLSPFTS